MKVSDLFKGIIKPWFKYVVYGALLLLLVLVMARSCRLTDRYSERVGELTAQVRMQKDAEKIALENVGHALERINKLTGENKKLIKHIELAELDLVDSDEDVVRLERELLEAQDTGDTEAQIFNLTEQVNVWKGRFALSQIIVADKDKIIFNLNQKYEKQVSISIDFEKLYIAEKDLRFKGEVLLGIATRKLRVSRVGGKFKTIAVGVLGGFIAYKLIKE